MYVFFKENILQNPTENISSIKNLNDEMMKEQVILYLFLMYNLYNIS